MYELAPPAKGVAQWSVSPFMPLLFVWCFMFVIWKVQLREEIKMANSTINLATQRFFISDKECSWNFGIASLLCGVGLKSLASQKAVKGI